MARAIHRPLSLGVALALMFALFAAAPRPAQAHDSCAIAQPAAPGALGAVMEAVNVFSSFVSTTAECVDKYAGVTPKLARDFETEASALQVTEAGAQAETYAECVDGMAAGMFPCEGIDMLAYVSMEELGTTFNNDIWGWTDPDTGKEYALVGASEGTVMVDISDPRDPKVQGILPTATTAGGDFWRDIKVFDDHAFVVSENTNHGVQIFDLTDLRDWDGTYTTYTEAARYTGHGSAHNLNINEDTGFAYSVGAGQTAQGITCSTGLHMFDINDPTDPEFAGCFDNHGYVHDTQCVVYEGPDAAYQGRELCFNSNPAGGNNVAVVDVTDKSNPVSLSRKPYPQSAYSHQGWLTEDQRFFIHGDELDELGHNIPTTTRVWDVTDVDNPILHQVFTYGTTSIDHNVYTEGRYANASNYTTGLRLFDSQDIEDEGLSQVAFFDVYPENDNASFEGGTWSNYPWYDGLPNVVAVNSIDRGLFILSTAPGMVSTLEDELDDIIDDAGITEGLADKIRHNLTTGAERLRMPGKELVALSNFERAVHLLLWQADVIENKNKPNQGDADALRALAASIQEFLDEYRD